MNREKILKFISQYILEEDLKEEDVLENIGLDSLDTVLLTIALEEEFNISLEEIEKNQTIKEVIDNVIKAKKEENDEKNS